MSLTVGRVAELAGVTVRTLHHYDEIGLLSPSERSTSGYRLYSDTDVARLRRILFYRELGIPLEQVSEIVNDPGTQALTHLRRQHQLLGEQIRRLSRMVDAIEKEMEAQQMGIALTPEEQLEVFGTARVGGEWADEAGDRWGDTDAYQQARRRTSAYTKADWIELTAQADQSRHDFAVLMGSGAPADGAQARSLAEAHRQYLTRWFYDCSYRGLAELYVSDKRFSATYDAVAPGLARYVHDAMIANAERADAGG